MRWRRKRGDTSAGRRRRGRENQRAIAMSPAELKAALLGEAQAMGFDLCRVAPAQVPPHAEEFHQWLADGRHGEMAWLARNADRRSDPQLVLPGAKSVQ